MIGPNADSGVPTLSATATMFAVPPIQLPESAANAVPPIQLPESAANPIQASSGRKRPKIRKAIGPPMTIPAVPTSTMMSATFPSWAIAFTSTATIKSRSANGSR